MTSQIAVRLPSELVEFVDGEVANGHAATRAAVVLKALKREQRRAVAERDVALLASSQPMSEGLDDLARFAGSQSFDHLD